MRRSLPARFSVSTAGKWLEVSESSSFRPFGEGGDRVKNVVKLVGVGVLLPAATAWTACLLAGTTVVVDRVQAVVQCLAGEAFEFI